MKSKTAKPDLDHIPSRGNSSRTPACEADIDLVERQRRVAKVAIPLKSSLAGCSIEGFQSAADEVNVLHLLEVLADIHWIAEDLG
jgi:hypothetical protein